MNNTYPSLPSQPIRAYSAESYSIQPNQFVPQNVTLTTAYHVEPVLPTKSHEAYPRLNNPGVHQQVHQPTYAYPQVPAPSHHYNPTPQQVQYKQPQNVNVHPQGQNKAYIELTETLRYEQPDYSYENTREDSRMLQHDHMMPGGLYPSLPSHVMPAGPQYGQFTNQLTVPIVYDPSLLHKISSRDPQIAFCNKCNKHVQTVVKHQIGTGTLVTSAFMTFCGAFPCAWVPCVTKSFKDAVHYCPACGEDIGRKNLLC